MESDEDAVGHVGGLDVVLLHQFVELEHLFVVLAPQESIQDRVVEDFVHLADVLGLQLKEELIGLLGSIVLAESLDVGGVADDVGSKVLLLLGHYLGPDLFHLLELVALDGAVQ